MGDGADGGDAGGFGGLGSGGLSAAMGGFSAGEGFGSLGGDAFGGAASDAAANGFGFGDSFGGLEGMFGPAAGYGAPTGVEGTFGEGYADPAAGISGIPGGTFGEQVAKFVKNPVINTILGLVAKTNPYAKAAYTAYNIATSANPAQTAMTTGLNFAGAKAGVPSIPGFGGLGNVANVANAAPGGNSGQSMGNASGGSFGLSDAIEGLGGLYAGMKGMNDNRSIMNELQALYSQNSPYAKQLRQQLDRRDAAAGRRSQYGPREVELQAKLAQLASGQIPAISQMNRNQILMRNATLGSTIDFLRKSGVMEYAKNGLNRLFNPTPNLDSIGWGNGVGEGLGQLQIPSVPNGGFNAPDLSNLWAN